MKTIILSDTHFGIRNNSITWLKSQLAGLDEVIKFCKQYNKEDIRIIHCGDLFDCRSAINVYTLFFVKDKLAELCSVVSDMYILGGNHDYYSPEESNYNVTSLDFIKLEQDEEAFRNLHIASQDVMEVDDVVLIPWFRFHNPETLQQAVDNLGDKKIIYTHTDLQHLPEDIKPIVDGISIPIITGHIHTPNLKNKKRLTIGSCYSITFIDANQSRGFYTIEDDDVNTLKFYELKNTIRFYRLYNQDIFDFDMDSLRSFDKVELYLNPEFHGDSVYKDKEREFQDRCDTSIIINSIQSLGESIDIHKFDFDDIIEQTVPDHLKEKFHALKCLMT